MVNILTDKSNYELSPFLRACFGRAFYLEPKAIRDLNACFNSFQKRIKKDKEDTIAAINALALEIEKVQKAIADADPDSETSRANQAETRLRIVKFLSEQSIVIKASTTITAAVPDIPNLSLSRTVYDKNLVVYNAQAQTLSLDKTAALNTLGLGGCGVPNANWHHPVNITSSVELFWDGALRPLADMASTAVSNAQAPPGISVSVTAAKTNPATLSTCIGPPQ